MSDGRYLYKRGVGYLLEFSPKWGLALELAHFEDNASLIFQLLFGKFYVRLPKVFHRPLPMGEMMISWGFSWNWSDRGEDIHLHWGSRTKILHMPWAYEHHRTDVLMGDGSWYRKLKREWGEVAGQFTEQHPYRYVLKSGAAQDRVATIDVEEMEWRWRWLKWLPFPRMIKRSIGVNFDKEVGERTGSWKGGCTGCGYTLRKGETPLECLRRMEKERKF